MKKLEVVAALFVALGFLGICGAGVDLNHTRIGPGMAILGIGGILFGCTTILSRSRPGNLWLFLSGLLGGSYFLWRALSGGPPGLAFADVTLVLVLLSIYFPVSSGSLGTLRTIIGALGILLAVNIGLTVAQTFWGPFPFVWRDGLGRPGSATGLFSHYNPFAGFMNGSIFIFLSLAIGLKKPFWKAVCGVLVAGSIFCVVASGSRGGWISLVAGVVVWLVVFLVYLKSTNSNRFGLALLCSIIVGVLAVILGTGHLEKINVQRAADFKDRYGFEVEAQMHDGGRLTFQQMAIEVFGESPVIGSGARAFSYRALEHWDPGERQIQDHNPEFAHNEFLQLLSDYGLVGFAIVLIAFVAHAIYGFLSVVFSEKEGPTPGTLLKIGAIAGLVALLTQCFFSFLMHVPACLALTGLLLAMMASGAGGTEGYVRGSLRSATLIAVSVLMILIGKPLWQSYHLQHDALASLRAEGNPQKVMKGLQMLHDAGTLGRDAGILERSGREAMIFASSAERAGDTKLAREFRMVARDHFLEALVLNPHLTVALAGLPMVYDGLGEFERAREGYVKAMDKIWMREFHLRPYFNASKSELIQGITQAMEGGDTAWPSALTHLVRGKNLLLKRRELLSIHREMPDEAKLRTDFQSWIAYVEGERLAIEGDRIWKHARPRNPELAYALMLEAAKRYEISEKVVSPLVKRWQPQWDRLRKNLELLESVRIKPAELTGEQISEIINPEAVLDPAPATR